MSVVGKGVLLVILIACVAAIVLRRARASAVADDGLASVAATSKRFATLIASLGGHSQRWEITPTP